MMSGVKESNERGEEGSRGRGEGEVQVKRIRGERDVESGGGKEVRSRGKWRRVNRRRGEKVALTSK